MFIYLKSYSVHYKNVASKTYWIWTNPSNIFLLDFIWIFVFGLIDFIWLLFYLHFPACTMYLTQSNSNCFHLFHLFCFVCNHSHCIYGLCVSCCFCKILFCIMCIPSPLFSCLCHSWFLTKFCISTLILAYSLILLFHPGLYSAFCLLDFVLHLGFCLPALNNLPLHLLPAYLPDTL